MADRQERYDEKLIQILWSACGIFAEKGFHHASVRDVASATGVSPAGLYYYFRSKEELLFLILDHTLDSLLGELHNATEGIRDPEPRLRAIIRAHLTYFSAHREEMRVLAQEWEALSGDFLQGILRRQRKYVAMVVRILRRLQPGTSRKELRASAMAFFGMISFVFQWYVPNRDLPIQALADHFAQLFLDGFNAREEGGTVPDAAPGREDAQADDELEGTPPSVLSGPAF